MSPALLNRLALSAVLGAVTSPALAEWRDVPYADMAKMPLTLAAVDPQHIYDTRYVAKAGDGQAKVPADLKIQVKAGGQLVPVAVRPDGRVELPIRQDWADGGAVVQVNQPKGRVKLSLSFTARVPPGTRMSYARLTESAPVMERGMKQMAGVMGLMAPSVQQLVLSFSRPGPQTVSLLLPGGAKQRWQTDDQGKALVPWDSKWLGGTVELSAPLKGIEQVMK